MRTGRVMMWMGVVAAAVTAHGACSNATGPTGPAYQANDIGPGRCVSMNEAGQVIGFDGHGHGFVVAADGTRSTLASIGDDTMTFPLAINAGGSIAGYADGTKGRHAAVWSASASGALPTRAPWSVATGIDDDGTVVGFGSSATGLVPDDLMKIDPKSIHGDAPPVLGFIVPSGRGWTPLPMPAGARSAAYAAGHGGRVVGIMEPASGVTHAFLYVNGAMQDLGTLGGDKSDAYAVNGGGDVVGVSTISGGGTDGHAFLFTGGHMQDLGTLGGTKSDARSINDSGVVVGSSTASDGSVHPFVYRDGHMIDVLPKDLHGVPYRMARAEHVTQSGKVVGWGVQARSPSDGSMRCVVWTPSR